MIIALEILDEIDKAVVALIIAREAITSTANEYFDEIELAENRITNAINMLRKELEKGT